MTTPSAVPTITPDSLNDLRDAVTDHAGPVLVAGAGTASDWAGTPETPAAVVSTAGLSGVISHNPGDMTVEVHAGTPLSELQAVLVEHGQRVALDAARVSEGATLGGLFATADSGPLAVAFGSLRDLVIGATVVLADGTVARSGGHVIKNVAGYDLTKLLHGAHGTLGVVGELVLRLHPTPETTATVALPAAAGEMADRAHAVARSPVEASAVQWHDDGEHGPRLLVRLEGTTDGVDGRLRRLLDALGSGAERLSPADAEAAWTAHAAAVNARPADRAVLRLGVTPSLLADVLAGLQRDAGGLTEVTVSPLTGVATVAVPATTEAVTAAHRRVAEAGGTSGLRQRPAGTELPGWGPAPSSAALLRAVAASFDPDQRLGRGRLAPWLPLPTGVTA